MAVLLGVTAVATAQSPFETGAAATPATEIDKLVFARLEKLGIPPANLCTDTVFVRRVFLDVIGTLPTAMETKEFLLDTRPDKRRALIDRLLARDEFADYWAMKWSDLLRVKAEFPINLWPNAAQAYHHWIHTAIQENKPYDQFVREILTASGSNFRIGQANFYRAMQNKDPQGIAQTVALTFMGARADKWPANRLAGQAAFFSQVGYKHTAEWKEEIVFWNSDSTNALPAGVLPDGQPVRFNGDRDPREIFADWLIDPKNPWFTRNIANRVWFWLQGRGIISEPDDIRPGNPPSNPQLLAYLESDLVASHYDLKQLFRAILNSKTYQLASIPKSDKPEAEANFAFYPLRRLDAEVVIDALNQLTSTTEKYSSSIPEPFTFIPDNMRSIALPDGSITSPFLEKFGRPARDTGLESERNNRINGAQKLTLLNSTLMQKKIESSRMIEFQTTSNRAPADIAIGMYLGILSRFPTAAEIKTAQDYFQSGIGKRHAAVDLAWALMNTTEFLYRH